MSSIGSVNSAVVMSAARAPAAAPKIAAKINDGDADDMPVAIKPATMGPGQLINKLA